jgi:hypothetical protein
MGDSKQKNGKKRLIRAAAVGCAITAQSATVIYGWRHN